MQLKGWRTVIVNVLVIIITGVITVLEGGEHLHGETLTIVLAVLNIALRYITTTPIGKPLP